MTDQERLTFLLSYHLNLTLQLQAEWHESTRQKINISLVMLEEEIESLLFKG